MMAGCGPCHAIAPAFTRLARNTPASTGLFLRVDVDQVPEVAQRYSVSAMPTFVFILQGTVKETLRGADPGSLQRLVDKYKSSASASQTFTGAGYTLSGSAATGPSSRSLRGHSLPSGPNWSHLLHSEHAFPLFLAAAYVLYVLSG